MGSIPALGRSPGGRNGNPLQYSYLKKIPCTEGDWRTRFHGVAKSHSVMTETGSHSVNAIAVTISLPLCCMWGV